MYAREVRGQTLTFAFPRGLLNDNLMFYDQETGSLWSQMAGKAVLGPLKETSLSAIPVLQTSWGHWRRLHPETEVMVAPPGSPARPYFYRSFAPGERSPSPLRAHDIRELGLGVSVGKRSRFYPFTQLGKTPSSFRDLLGGREIQVHSDPSVPTAWTTDPQGRLIQTTLAYRRAWFAFHPDSETYAAP